MNSQRLGRMGGVKAANIIFISLIMVLSIPPAIAHSEKSRDNIIRVSIADDKDMITLELKGKYKIYAIDTDRVVMEGRFLIADCGPTREGLRVGERPVKNYGIKVKVARDANIYVNRRRFRGDIDVIKKENGKLMVINHIDLDDYLYGVLYHEVSHRWPMSVLKAQAIVARTFALYEARQNKRERYDLRSDIYSQVYGGRTSEKWSTTMAVNLTRAKVLTYKGDIFPTYYHATCGGFTEDASNLWNIDISSLKGVACNFCKSSPHYKWVGEIPLWRLENELKDNGFRIGKIVSVAILSKNRSGRVDKIEIEDDTGVSVVLTGKDFRQIIGPNDVRSTKFDVSIKWNNLILNGLGWGHGVGMCQWGAFGMARKGKTAEEILEHYYPGAEVASIDKVRQ